jgi:hypothetical protein
MEDTHEHFKLCGGKYTYFMTIRTMYDMSSRPISYGIDVGGKMKGCLRVTVNAMNKDMMRDERFRFLEKSKQNAYISWIGYNKKCSLTDNFVKGDGTRHMLKCAMIFVTQKYPWIEGFTLLDESKIMCDGVEVSLSRLSIAMHGKTYYERYFKAHLLDPNQGNTYTNAIKMLNGSDFKMPFQIFSNKFFISKDIFNILKPLYEMSHNYNDFFKLLRKQFPRTFCSVISPWINGFVDFFVGDIWMQKWIIEKKYIRHGSVYVSNLLDLPEVSAANNIIQEEFKSFTQSGGCNAMLCPEDVFDDFK